MKWGPRALSLATGFLSLSQEILWIRYTGFAFFGLPQVFGLVLCFYLAGIACGADLGKRWCSGERDLYRSVGQVLLLASVFDLAAPWLATATMGFSRLLCVALLPLLVFLTALFKSTAFPVAHYLGSERSGPKVGSSVSKVYFANIVGSTLGPLVTGFLLLDVLNLQQAFELMAALTAIVALACLQASLRRPAPAAWVTLALVIAAWPLTPQWLMPSLIHATRQDGSTLHFLVETRVGVIHTTRKAGEADTTYGGNVYDGMVSVDFIRDENSIYRLFALGAMQPHIRRVLLIGLSSGAWVQAIRGFPELERVDAVEINPGYLPLIRQYPEVRELLADPRVQIHIDDGRRWIRRTSGTFDLIAINNTWHWRAYSSLLLSREFVRICKAHLKVGGAFTYNTTWSPDAYSTVAGEFAYSYRLGNFAVGSDQPMQLSPDSLRAALRRMSVSGQPLVPLHDPRAEARIHAAVANFVPYTLWRSELVTSSGREPELITDQNLVGEYRHSDLSPLGQQLWQLRDRLRLPGR